MTKSDQRLLFTGLLLMGGIYVVARWGPQIGAFFSDLFSGLKGGAPSTNGGTEELSWLEKLLQQLGGGGSTPDNLSSIIDSLQDLLNQKNGAGQQDLSWLTTLLAGGGAAGGTAAGTTAGAAAGAAAGKAAGAATAGSALWNLFGVSVPLYLGLAPWAPGQVGALGDLIGETVFDIEPWEPGQFTKRKATPSESERAYWAGMLPAGTSLKGLTNAQVKALALSLQ